MNVMSSRLSRIGVLVASVALLATASPALAAPQPSGASPASTTAASTTAASPTAASPTAASDRGGARQSAVDHRAIRPNSQAGTTSKPIVPHAAAATSGRQSVVYYGPITVTPHSSWDIWVFCPSGRLPTSGGEYNNLSGGITLHDSYARHDWSGWQVKVTNDSSASANVTTYAVCLSGLSTYQQVTSQQPLYVAPGTRGTTAAYCPDYLAPLGGGGWSDSLETYADVTLRGSGDGSWLYGGRNVGGAGHNVTAQIICGTPISGYQVIRSAGVAVNPGQYTSAYVACPANYSLIAGGGYGGRLTDSYPDGTGWRIYAYNDTGQFGYLDMSVICGN
jgi:hypothetical protein